ncbi:response regulator [bacterium]|nr:response regulator [bacterium]
MNDLNVLIAGTSSSYLEISKRMLKYHYTNCHVDFALSGKECIDKIATNDYDLVLFDYDLGDMNGLEFIKSVKEQRRKVPLIMLVDEGEDQIALQSIEIGAADYILKVRGYLTALPITIRNILERKNLLSTQRTTVSGGTPRRAVSEDRKKVHFILDRRGRILSANPNMSAITNYTEDELMELYLPDLIPKEREKPFYDWLNSINDNGNSDAPFTTEIVGKTGNKVMLDITLTAIRDENQQIVSYRGNVKKAYENLAAPKSNGESSFDQLNMMNQISEAIISSHYHPFNFLLEKIAEIACQIFRFRRCTIALLDKKKKVFIKQSMVGYFPSPRPEGASLEVPQEVIDRIFSDRFLVKVIYYDQVHRSTANYINSKFPERRTQKRRLPAQWHKRDLILVNLMDRKGNTFGYISLDFPIENHIPLHSTFHNLQLFGQLVSMAIENYYQFSTLEKSSRRLKQVLITSNIFKLYLSLGELLKEIVWSIKFSLGFNLVVLGLISKKTGSLEIKAVACDDKIKQNHLLSQRLPLAPLAALFRREYAVSKSYLVIREEEVLHPMKSIYYGASTGSTENDGWPNSAQLLVPIKSRESKVIGMIIVDDPEDRRWPNQEIIRTLEILANQVAVAIDNRVLYVQARKRIQELERHQESSRQIDDDTVASGLKGFVDRFFN